MSPQYVPLLLILAAIVSPIFGAPENLPLDLVDSEPDQKVGYKEPDRKVNETFLRGVTWGGAEWSNLNNAAPVTTFFSSVWFIVTATAAGVLVVEIIVFIAIMCMKRFSD